MEFRDLVQQKRQESREAFVSMMQERKKLIDAGSTPAEADQAMLEKYGE